MPKKQTEKSRYPSKYSPQKYVTAAQYICELICEKKAASEGKTLPTFFWRLKEWKSFFSSNLRITHATLKKYDERAIIKTLRNSGKWWSLRSPIMQEKICAAHKELQRKAEDVTEYKRVTKTNVRDRSVKKNRLSILEELDNG